ncbi:putative ribonuclease H-like domain-containing protein [Tanacetum coccineum]
MKSTTSRDSMQLTDLMVLCTKLQTQVLDLEKAKDAQAKEIAALKKRFQRLERKKKSRPIGMKRLKKVDLDKDDDVTLVDETQERQDGELMFNTRVLDTDEMSVEAKVGEKDEQSTKLDDSTAGEAIKAAKHKVVTTAATTTTTTRPKARGVVVQEPSEFKAPQEAQPSISKDKGKGIMIEPEVPLKRKNQIILDEQIARDIQAKLDVELIDEEKLARKQEEEANIAFIESYKELDEVEEDDEAELKKYLVIKKDEDIAINAIPLATKPPVIVDYKLLKEGIMGIDREDLLTLWKLVKTKHGEIRPENDHERVMWGYFKVMFEQDIRSDVWRNLQGYRVTIWKLIDLSGVHFVRFENVHIFMLVEKRYPLTSITITNMLNMKLQTDHLNEMCYQLLKLMGNPQQDLEDQGVIDSGCSRHLTGNMSYLTDFEEIGGGYVAFGGNPKRGKITGRVPRKNNMYSVDLKNIVPKEGLTCLFSKATSDESNLWHRRLRHINFKTMNKLVKGNLVRGLPSKLFENNQTCVACQKGKQHRASSTKDETSGILKSFITRVENLIDQKVKVIRCDNGTGFKNKEMNQFCKRKGIKREFSVARTPQQNGVAERKNRTLIEAARTIKPALGLMKPFGCPIIILNTIDHLGKFDGKADEGFFVGYLINSKAFRVFISRTRIVKENLHVQFRNQSNSNTGTKACDDTGKARMETVPGKDYIMLPLWTADPPFSHSSKSSLNAGFKPSDDDRRKVDENPRKDSEGIVQEKEDNVNSTNNINAASTNEVNVVGVKTSIELPIDPDMPKLEDIVYSDDDEDVGAEADMNNLDAFMPVSLIPTTRVHKDYPVEQIIGDLNSAPQTRRMTKNLEEHGLFSSVQQRTNHKDFQNYLFACFLSQEEPEKIDVKSAFLYGKIEEEVYVCQPLGFEDPDFPDKVYKVEKALYGLHQAPRAWYETLSTYLLDNGF